MFLSATPQLPMLEQREYCKKEIRDIVSALTEKESEFLIESIRSGVTNIQPALEILDDECADDEKPASDRASKALGKNPISVFDINLTSFLENSGTERREFIIDEIKRTEKKSPSEIKKEGEQTTFLN